MKTYHGRPSTPPVVAVLTVDSKGKVKADMLAGQSTDRLFAWGAVEPGATLLAKSLLRDVLGNEAQAVTYHQRFKHKIIRPLDAATEWTLTEEQIAAEIADIKEVEKEMAPARRAAQMAASKSAGEVAREGGDGVAWTKGADDGKEN